MSITPTTTQSFQNKMIVLLLTFLIGSIIPFIDALVVIQAFYLLIPLTLMAFLSIISLIYLAFSWKNNFKALFFALIVPVLLVAEITTPAIISSIQRYRAEQLIHQISSEGGIKNDLGLGLKYEPRNDRTFRLSYSRGFMVQETYDSQTQQWISRGWND